MLTVKQALGIILNNITNKAPCVCKGLACEQCPLYMGGLPCFIIIDTNSLVQFILANYDLKPKGGTQ